MDWRKNNWKCRASWLWIFCCRKKEELVIAMLSLGATEHTRRKTPKTTGQSWDGWRKCLGGGRWLVRQKGLREEIAKARIKKEGRDKRWWRSLRHCWFGLAVQYVSLIIVFYKKNARNILESGVNFSWFFLCNVRHVVHDVFFSIQLFFIKAFSYWFLHRQFLFSCVPK